MDAFCTRSIDEKDLDTILAEDIEFTGDIFFKQPFMIKGKVEGSILAEGELYIDTNSKVNAKIEADIVSIKGKVKGNVKAKKRIEIFSGAFLDGDITAPDLVIESGSKLNGNCKMPKDSAHEK
ncbi:MAG: polymer-forming cytoskeletal protein [Spirochaetia bacterium]